MQEVGREVWPPIRKRDERLDSNMAGNIEKRFGYSTHFDGWHPSKNRFVTLIFENTLRGDFFLIISRSCTAKISPPAE
jgi:hypothetical protein